MNDHASATSSNEEDEDDDSLSQSDDGSFHLEKWIDDEDYELDLRRRDNPIDDIAAALCDPDNFAIVSDIKSLVLHPGLSSLTQQAIDRVAQFLGTTRSVTTIKVRSQQQTTMAREVLDQWLAALTHNDDIPLELLAYGSDVVSSPSVFADFCRAKLSNATLESDQMSNVSVYLDPALQISSLSLHVVPLPANLFFFFQDMRRLLPAATALRKLSLDFTVGSSTAYDYSVLFTAPSLQSLHLVGGYIDQVPARANTALRELSLSLTRLGPNASQVLACLESLESLSFRMCAVRQPVLRANTRSLKRLVVEWCSDIQWRQQEFEALQENRLLECLVLRGNQADRHFVTRLASFLENDQCRLKCLVFHPDSVDLTVFMQSVARNKTLEHFGTQWSVRDSPTGRSALVTAYQENPRLLYTPLLDWDVVQPADGSEAGEWRAFVDQLLWQQQVNLFGLGLVRSRSVPLGVWPVVMAQIGARRKRSCPCPHCDTGQELKVDVESVLYSFLRAIPSLVQPGRRGWHRDAASLIRVEQQFV